MSDVATQSREPSLRFMLSHPAHRNFVGLWCRSRAVRTRTFGTLLGLFTARWLQPCWATRSFAALFGALLIGTWRPVLPGALGESDHGAIVWDEVIAMALITAMLPGAMWKQARRFCCSAFSISQTRAGRLG